MGRYLQIAKSELRKRLSVRARRRIALARVRVRRPTAALRKLPSLLIIGTQRGGTSTLYKSLSGSPHVAAPLRKETEYFSRDFYRGESWYRAHFPLKTDRRPTFEATPDYLFDPLAPGRAASLLPAAKVVVLLRDPVERAWSHYQHMRRLGFERETFEDALAAEEERMRGDTAARKRNPLHRASETMWFSYFSRGLYAAQLRNWFQHFDRGQFLIRRSEDFFANPELLVEEIHEFVNLPRWSQSSTRNWSYQSGVAVRQQMPEAARDRLRRLFDEPNRELEGLLGHEFCWPG